jgi:hypothetical protein
LRPRYKSANLKPARLEVTEISDLSNEVIVRTLNAFAEEIPGSLHSDLLALFKSGAIYDGHAIAKAVSKAANLSVPYAN